MPKIQIREDLFKIDKSFVSGKDRIILNGKILFEGKFTSKELHRFNIDDREYLIEIDKIEGGSRIYHIQIRKNNELIHEGLFDVTGKKVENIGEAEAKANVRFCMIAGTVVGAIVIYFASSKIGLVVPGDVFGSAMRGGVAGAIGAMVGGLIGYGIGCLFYGKPKA